MSRQATAPTTAPYRVEVDFPEPPRFRDAQDTQAFEQFYSRLKRCVLDKLESLAAELAKK